MSAKKQNGWGDAVHDAATGYAVVVLGIVCFLLVLAVLMAGVRVVVGGGQTTNVAATTTPATATNTYQGRTA